MYIYRAIATCLLATTVLAQDPQPQPRGSETLLRQVKLQLQCKDSPRRTLSLRYQPRTWTRAQLARCHASGKRWHPGGSSWTVFDSPLDLVFDRPGRGDRDGARLFLPAGEYVLSLQNGDEEEPPMLLFTPRPWLRSAGGADSSLDALTALGGVWIPVEAAETERSSASLRIDLEPEDADSGALSIQLGQSSWDLSFTGSEPRPGRGANQLRRMRTPFLTAQLRRHQIEAQVCELLLHPRPLTIFSLDPDSGGDERPGPRFHGYRILGNANQQRGIPANERDAARLLQVLVAAILQKTDSAVADCFLPRHGLRIPYRGGHLDLVICFQCNSVLVHSSKAGLKFRSFRVASGRSADFSKTFRRLGLPVAK